MNEMESPHKMVSEEGEENKYNLYLVCGKIRMVVRVRGVTKVSRVLKEF